MAKAVVVLGAVGLGAFVLMRAFSLGKGILSGDNALTRNARDSDGNKVDGYVGVPVLGTLGAVTNEASGGYLATLGGWIGRNAYDLFNPSPDPNTPTASYDETDRLLNRYPAPNAPAPTEIYGGWG